MSLLRTISSNVGNFHPKSFKIGRNFRKNSKSQISILKTRKRRFWAWKTRFQNKI